MPVEAAGIEVIRLPWSQCLGGAALFVRMGACLAVAPVFGTAAAPPQLRAGFAALLTALLLPVVPARDLAAGIFGLAVDVFPMLVGRLLVRALVLGLAIAAADCALARWRWYRSLYTTRQELRDEQRETEGSPEVRSRIRARQRELARRRMTTP